MNIFVLDDEVVSLDDLIAANAETLDERTVAELRALRPGEFLVLGGGAWAESVIRCQETTP